MSSWADFELKQSLQVSTKSAQMLSIEGWHSMNIFNILNLIENPIYLLLVSDTNLKKLPILYIQ